MVPAAREFIINDAQCSHGSFKRSFHLRNLEHRVSQWNFSLSYCTQYFGKRSQYVSIFHLLLLFWLFARIFSSVFVNFSVYKRCGGGFPFALYIVLWYCRGVTQAFPFRVTVFGCPWVVEGVHRVLTLQAGSRLFWGRFLAGNRALPYPHRTRNPYTPPLQRQPSRENGSMRKHTHDAVPSATTPQTTLV